MTQDAVLKLDHEELEYLLDLMGEMTDLDDFDTEHEEELHNRAQQKLVRMFEEVAP